MKYIKGFDTLRAISISMVVIAHSLPNFWLQESRGWHLISGDTGVLVFFVISGFLITSLLFNEKEKFGRINFKNFFIRRFLRLLPPLVLFYLSILVLMSTGMIQETYIGLGISVFYLYNFVPNKFYTPELGHTWSLALEEQFYFTWPFILTRIMKPRYLLFLGFLLVLISILFLLFLYPMQFFGHFKAQRWFIPAISPIMIGSMLAISRDWLEQKFRSTTLMFVCFLVLYSTPLYCPEKILIISPIFQSFGIGCLLLLIIKNQNSLGVQILNNKVTSYIGKISYGIYVYQGLFLRTGPGSEWWFQQFPQNLILTLVIAILSFELIEKYYLKKKKEFTTIK
ncbi:MAG: acyltransferase [Flavobacteriales bacterium]|nr:acyltransferase [Flavobacteriales bacterium]